MYKIRFYLGAPYASPRACVAEADSQWDCPWKALEEAREKASAVREALSMAFAKQPIPKPPRKLTAEEILLEGRRIHKAAEVDARLGYKAQWQDHSPKPKPAVVVVEVAIYKDDCQLPLFDMPSTAPMPPRPKKDEYRATGDFIGRIELDLSEKIPDVTVEIGQVEYANTNSAHALGRAVETARGLMANLKKDPGMKPYSKLLNFRNVTVTVEQINDNYLLLNMDEEPYDWTSLSYPSPRF